MGGTIYLPDSMRPQSPEVTREQEQMAKELYEVSDKLAYFNKELYLIDEHLSVKMAKPKTTVMGLKPGYYHLVRMRPGHLAYIKPIEGPNGEWRDLDNSVFQLAGEDDLWNDRVQRERRRVARKAQEARDRQILRERADRAAEFDERLKSMLNVSIAVPRSITK